MGSNTIFLLELLEWFDETGAMFAYRLPESGSAEIKFGAQLIVRESQAAVFYYQGKAVGAFGPGRHTLKTANIPLLSKIMGAPWGLSSPLRAEVYFINTKTFTDLKWGTRDPVAFKDAELGLIRLRAHGNFNVRITQPVLFINSLTGTQQSFTRQDMEAYLNRVVVSRFNDYMGETIDSILNLPSQYDELSAALISRITDDFSHFGISLTHLYINAITPPSEVQKAIDDRSRMNAIEDMDKLIKLKAAMAMEKAASSENTAGDAIGMGMGLMLPGVLSKLQEHSSSPMAGPGAPPRQSFCPECDNQIPDSARFCPQCGHQILIIHQCKHCGENLTPTARFCSNCGQPAGEGTDPPALICIHCGSENLPGALFCNQCGDKISTS